MLFRSSGRLLETFGSDSQGGYSRANPLTFTYIHSIDTVTRNSDGSEHKYVLVAENSCVRFVNRRTGQEGDGRIGMSQPSHILGWLVKECCHA